MGISFESKHILGRGDKGDKGWSSNKTVNNAFECISLGLSAIGMDFTLDLGFELRLMRRPNDTDRK